MGRKPDVLVPPEVKSFIRTGSAPRPFAVANRDPGHPAEPWVAAPQVVPEAEEPSDTALKASLCGVPIAYETERWCRACGPLTSDGHAPLCACGRRVESRRTVTRRADPVEFGPIVRVEQRDIDPETGKVLGKHVICDRLSRVRLMLPDEDGRKQRRKLGIAGNQSPGKLFRLETR
jgi:hypothetical protein